MRKIKVGIIQQANASDIRINLMNLAKSIEACAANGAQLVVLQELHNSLYFCQTENTDLFELAEPIPGPSTGFYSELAAANRIVLVTSLFEKRAPGLYHNTAVVFDRDGSIAGKYRKMHIPDDPAYYEKFYFTPGDIGFEPIQTSLGKLGVLVCWDQWYPEAARLMALIGQTYSDKVDSQNTLPVFLGKGGNGRKELVLEGYFNYALRDGDWVMIPPYPDTYGDAEEAAFAGNSNCYQLYNVKEDIGQQVNLAEKEPKRLRQMMMTFERLKRETGKITNF